MRRVVKRIPKHINTYCTFCKAEGKLKIVALWRLSYDHNNRACEDHREALAQVEAKRKLMDGCYSEADYQSWMRL